MKLSITVIFNWVSYHQKRGQNIENPVARSFSASTLQKRLRPQAKTKPITFQYFRHLIENRSTEEASDIISWILLAF